MDILSAANESHRGHAVAVVIHHILGSLYHSRVIAKSEIVVGTEVNDSLAIGCDFGGLCGGYNTLLLVGSCCSNLSNNTSTDFV